LLLDYPRTAFLHYIYGTALASLSRYDEATVQLHEEIRLNPESPLPYLRLASMALVQHHPEEALPAAKRAVELAPDSAEAHYAMGRTLLELAKAEEAVKELEIASKIARSSPGVHFNLARAYAKARQPKEAEREREIFTRLNDQAERQRTHGSQAYGSHDRGGLAPEPVETARPE